MTTADTGERTAFSAITLLGRFAVQWGRGPVSLPAGLQRLVAYVALHSPVPRPLILAQFWPDVPEDRAQGRLRTMLWQVQRICPGLLSAARLDLSLGTDARVDATEVCRRALRILTDPASASLEDLTTDVAMEPLLPGWYDEWVLAERERSHQLRLHALESGARELLARGRPGNALHAALTAVAVDPFRESAHRIVMEIHLAEGNTVDAVRQYLRCRETLCREIGVPPSPQTTQLVEAWVPRSRQITRPAFPTNDILQPQAPLEWPVGR